MEQGLRPPQDHRRSPSWSQFLGQYKDFIWACDFFTVTTARLQTFYVLFFMELGRRRLLLFNVTEHPQAEWVVHPSLTHRVDPVPDMGRKMLKRSVTLICGCPLALCKLLAT